MSLSQNFPTIRPSLLLDFASARRLDPRITFTRSTTAVYYDGVTQSLAEQNLSLYSQDYTQTQWLKAATSITATNILAPDGTNSASELTANGVLAIHELTTNQAVFTNGLIYTQTFFLKANTNNFAQLRFSGGLGGAFVNFNLSTGAVGTSGNGGVGSITSVGNSWYRCSITATVTATGSGLPCGVYIVSSQSASSAETNSLSTSLYVWGAQMEQRSTATAYTVTTTQAITNYIPVLVTAPAGVARFDFDPVADVSLGLLIEEARTNIVLYSSQFDNAYWSKTNATVTSNTIIAPDGTLTGDRLFEDTNNGVHRVFSTGISTTAGTAYTGSCYVKAGERTRVAIELRASAVLGTIIFNLSNGTVVNSISGFTASIQNVGNGWYRCSVTAGTTITTTGSGTLIIYLDNGSTTLYTGNGYAGLFIWGAQVEAGAFATTYIATVATTQTRTADSASMTGTNFSSWYNAGEGTLYGEGISSAFNSAIAAISSATAGSSGNSNQFSIRYASATPGTNTRFAGNFYDDVQFDIFIASSTFGTNRKLALAIKVNDVAASTNGSAVTTDTSVIMPVGVNQMIIGGATFGAVGYYCGTIKKIAYYDSRLTNAQIQTLTRP
jgi:hypothetical protein